MFRRCSSASAPGVSYGALGTHAPFAARPRRPARDQQPHHRRPGGQFRDARSHPRRGAGRPSPCFVRFGKAAMYDLHRPDTEFEVGRAITLREGNDVAFIATGETVVHALLAAGAAGRAQGMSCRVLSMHTVKPLDTEAILRAGRECRAVVTVEEHMVHGGLGEACAARCCKAASPSRSASSASPTRKPSPARRRTSSGTTGSRWKGSPKPPRRAAAEHRMSYILAIDQSTSATKAVALRRRGQGARQGRRASTGRSIRSPAGWSTTRRRSGRTSSRVVGELVAQAPGQAGVDWPASASPTSARRSSSSTAGPASRLHHAIVWQCRRGEAICRELEEAGHGDARHASDRAAARHLFLRLEAEVADRATSRTSPPKLQSGRGAHRHHRRLSHPSADRRRGLRHRPHQRQPHAALRHRQAALGRGALRALRRADRGVAGSAREQLRRLARPTFGGLLPEPVPICRRDGRLAGVALRATLLRARHGQGHLRHRLVGAAEHWGRTCSFSESGSVPHLAWVWRGRPTYAFEGIINYSAATIAWLKDQLGLLQIVRGSRRARGRGAGQRRRLSGAGLRRAQRAVLEARRPGGHRRADRIRHATTSCARREESIAYQIRDVLDMMNEDAGVPLQDDPGRRRPDANAFLMQFTRRHRWASSSTSPRCRIAPRLGAADGRHAGPGRLLQPG